MAGQEMVHVDVWQLAGVINETMAIRMRGGVGVGWGCWVAEHIGVLWADCSNPPPASSLLKRGWGARSPSHPLPVTDRHDLFPCPLPRHLFTRRPLVTRPRTVCDVSANINIYIPLGRESHPGSRHGTQPASDTDPGRHQTQTPAGSRHGTLPAADTVPCRQQTQTPAGSRHGTRPAADTDPGRQQTRYPAGSRHGTRPAADKGLLVLVLVSGLCRTTPLSGVVRTSKCPGSSGDMVGKNQGCVELYRTTPPLSEALGPLHYQGLCRTTPLSGVL